MPIPRIVIVTPAPPGTHSGNRRTALRWARLLRDLGCRVSVHTSWTGQPCDAMVALHARRSHDSLKAFCRAHPAKPALLALTGTDLYRDIRESDEARSSLDMATRLIVLQQAGPSEFDAGQRARTRVIYQSEIARYPWRPPKRFFQICILGHLRPEKDPFRGAGALCQIDADMSVRMIQAGKALSEDMACRAASWAARDERYRWIGEVPHGRALKLLAGSHAMLISSRLEGGAHVVSEAIAHGVPVLASDIPGNRGMLGDDYRAYYPSGDAHALARLLRRAVDEPAFLAGLHDDVVLRQPLVRPQREREAWSELLAECSITMS